MAEMLLVIKANLNTVYLAPSTEIDEDDITEDTNENEDELQIIDVKNFDIVLCLSDYSLILIFDHIKEILKI
jgi:hypothetical protein